MDSDPEDGYYIVVAVLDDSATLWALDGIRQKKEE
ncbi:MAG: hypothetical protein H6Q68_2832 [Firmicutes bacterium]|nr:hypothetical protein [Bacillota bacterium]